MVTKIINKPEKIFGHFNKIKLISMVVCEKGDSAKLILYV